MSYPKASVAISVISAWFRYNGGNRHLPRAQFDVVRRAVARAGTQTRAHFAALEVDRRFPPQGTLAEGLEARLGLDDGALEQLWTDVGIEFQRLLAPGGDPYLADAIRDLRGALVGFRPDGNCPHNWLLSGLDAGMGELVASALVPDAFGQPEWAEPGPHEIRDARTPGGPR